MSVGASAHGERDHFRHHVISFASGAAFGMASVVTAQPFDTIKTRMQAGISAPQSAGVQHAATSQSARQVFTELFAREGVRGLYRGGTPLFVGGALFRSAQFGCYDVALQLLGGPVKKEHRVMGGALDPHVVAAGFVGGLGRGIVESPFEYAKVRRQVESTWRLRDVYRGSSITIFRNSFLFAAFAINMDVVRHFYGPLSPFWNGALCANAAWMMIWPLDVLKSRRQSGLYEGVPTLTLMRDIFRSGDIFRGLIPGVMRSTVANGCGMFVYVRVQSFLLNSTAPSQAPSVKDEH